MWRGGHPVSRNWPRLCFGLRRNRRQKRVNRNASGVKGPQQRALYNAEAFLFYEIGSQKSNDVT